jgi:hypothetical protein
VKLASSNNSHILKKYKKSFSSLIRLHSDYFVEQIGTFDRWLEESSHEGRHWAGKRLTVKVSPSGLKQGEQKTVQWEGWRRGSRESVHRGITCLYRCLMKCCINISSTVCGILLLIFTWEFSSHSETWHHSVCERH